MTEFKPYNLLKDFLANNTLPKERREEILSMLAVDLMTCLNVDSELSEHDGVWSITTDDNNQSLNDFIEEYKRQTGGAEIIPFPTYLVS